MKQYLVTAYDYRDADALSRRMNVRPSHLDGVRDLKKNEHYLIGGAILNDEGKMTGTVMILQFENDGQLKHWEQTEPYITQKIWETYEVKPFKVAEVAQELNSDARSSEVG